MDKALQRSEQKLLANLIEGLRYLDLQESMSEKRTYDARSLTSAENPRYSHVALKVSGNGRELFFHRCRNYWYFSTGTNGTNYQLMDMIERFDLPMAGAGIHQVIQSLLGIELVDDVVETSPKQASREATSPDLPDEPSLDSDATYNLLLELLIRSGSKDDLETSEYADSLATDWETDTLSALSMGKDCEIGNLWLGKVKTTNKRAKSVISDLNSQLPTLYADGVTDDDIVAWWNMPVARQNLCKAHSYALLRSRVEVRMSALQREGIKENVGPLSYIQALCVVPVFGESIVSDQGHIEPRSPLPWELFTRVTDFFLKDVKENPNWEIEAIELRSYNAYFRLRDETQRS